MSFKNSPVIFLTRKVWEYSKGNRKSVVLFFSLFIIANLISFLEPLVVAKLLNTIQERGITESSFPVIIKIIALFVVINISFWIFHGPARVIEKKNAFLVRANYKKYLIDGTLNLSPAWHTDHHSGETIDKIEKSTNALYIYSGRLFEVIHTVVLFISSYIVLAYFNLHSSYIVLFMTIIAVSMVLKFDKFLSKEYKELYKAENKISAKIFDVISNITTVIILRLEKMLSRAILKKIMNPFSLYRHNIKITELKWFLVSLCTTIMLFLVIATYIYSNLKSGTVILAGTIYLLYGYVQRINDLFFDFAYRYGNIVRQKTAIENVESISDRFRVNKRIKSIKLDDTWNEIKIQNLNFSYVDKEEGKFNLRNVLFSIKRKERIALIGESGGGKSTILKVMRGLYETEEADLFLDGKPLKGGFNAIRANITLIPQEPEIFTSTIKENITMGINYKITHITKYTDMALFTKVVEQLPNKFQSSIVEKGVNLSGGEKQRLALARGLLASENKSIVFLDEPTSSVDTKNELDIYKNIFREFKDKTIISSVHKLHLLHMFDRIYLFSGGRVKAAGTFKELFDSSTEFRAMWRKYNQTMDQ
ncbi:MAG: ABC transporter ATP-binding protein [Nanoarchaeota archaeon]|nr:ABC transporter ATP-binding protein [Nanoarchaeota archaeon]